METKITATELSKNLSDVLNRIRYKGETFLIQRNGETLAKLEPVKKAITWAEFVELWSRNRPDDKFADDLEAALEEMRQPMPDPPEWPD